MGKKKKKTFDDQDQVDDVSTDEDTKNSGNQELSPSCPHVNKAVNVAALKKSLKPAFLKIGTCGACSKEKRLNSLQTQNLGYVILN